MMKLILLFISINIGYLCAGTPDILMYSNLKKDWSHYFTRQIRDFLDNINIDDPLKTIIDEDIELFNGSLQSLIEPGPRALDLLDTGFNLNLNHSQTRILIKKLAFEFKDMSASFKYKENIGPDVLWRADINGKGIILGADEFVVEIEIFQNQSLPPLRIIVKKPEISIHQEDALNFYSDMSLVHENNKSYAKFYNADFSRTTNWLMDHEQDYELTYDDIVLPDFKIKIGSKEIVFDQDKLDALIKTSLPEIKHLLTELMIKQFHDGVGLDLLKNIEKFHYPNKQWIEADSLAFSWNLEKISSLNNKDIIGFEFKSQFCLPLNYKIQKEKCVQNLSKPSKFYYPDGSFIKSLKNIENRLINNDANLIFSFSENYFNRLLQRTIEANYWEDALSENDLALGPMGVFSRMNEKGEINIYMDTIYLAKKSLKKILGAKDIRFPIKINMDFRIEDRDNLPVFIIHIKNFDMNQDSLIKGYNELGLDGLQEQKRLRKLTANKILKKLEPYQGTDVFILPMPILKSLHLENTIFKSDGNGRVNASIKYLD